VEYFHIDADSFAVKHGGLFESLRPPQVYRENQLIYQQGDAADYVYYLKSGKVKVYIASQDGFDKTLVTLSKGSLFGKASFFDNTPRTSSAVALQPSEIIAVDRQTMKQLFQLRPDVAIELLEYLSKTIRLLSVHIDWLAFEQADKRLARFLCESYNPTQHAIDCTHEEIGERIGVSRVTVSRALSRFREKGWIDTKYKEIDILDFCAIQEFAYN
jgi:CRP/FNR family transcriptional regulator